MSDVFNNIGLLAGQNQFLAYFIIYIATIFLGNISAFASFWLVFRGYFGPWGIPFLILTIFLADATGDVLWYSLGRTLRDTRFGNFVKNHLPGHEKIEKRLTKSARKWIFLSKFIYSSSFPILFSVGWVRMDFKTYIKTALVAILSWLPILSLLAYGLISGLTPLQAVAIFKRFEVVFIVGLAAFIAADYLLAKLFKFLFKKWWGGLSDNGEAQDATPPFRDQ
ncbi:MAG: VTT domain-containing protein [bacterium]|nr:VTT domain-containing protein [bacterium]